MSFKKVEQPETKPLLSLTLSGEQLRSYIERIQKLDEDKKAISDDIKDIYAEIKGNGFNAAIVKQIVKLLSMDRDMRMEMEEMLDLYKQAIGID